MSRRSGNMDYAQVMADSRAVWETYGSRLQNTVKAVKRQEAEEICQAVITGKENLIENIRQVPKAPYGYMAENGVISYNGVSFVCDEKTNSICLGNMDDKENVLTIALSGGGHLKVHRDNLGDLSRAAGMFSPEDLNLIMRAIAQDTKLQSMKNEIDDMEAGVGSRIGSGGRTAEKTDGEE